MTQRRLFRKAKFSGNSNAVKADMGVNAELPDMLLKIIQHEERQKRQRDQTSDQPKPPRVNHTRIYHSLHSAKTRTKRSQRGS